MSAPENPPAFPVAMIPEWQEGSPGMSLRDWFAGRALAGMASIVTDDGDMLMGWADMAKASYLAAAAMLAERGRAESAAPAIQAVCAICNLSETLSGQKWQPGDCECCPF
jgi:hypothetical protein